MLTANNEHIIEEVVKSMSKVTEPELIERVSRLRSIDVTAERLGVSPFTVRRKIKCGALKAVRIGRRILVSDSAIEDVIQNGCKE
jgi:excisionase family DNA binding protein